MMLFSLSLPLLLKPPQLTPHKQRALPAILISTHSSSIEGVNDAGGQANCRMVKHKTSEQLLLFGDYQPVDLPVCAILVVVLLQTMMRTVCVRTARDAKPADSDSPNISTY